MIGNSAFQELSRDDLRRRWLIHRLMCQGEVDPAAYAGVFGEALSGRVIVAGHDVVEDPVHVHDFQATVLHLLGIDHERLTYRHQGRHYRLTDVHGRVVPELLA